MDARDNSNMPFGAEDQGGPDNRRGLDPQCVDAERHDGDSSLLKCDSLLIGPAAFRTDIQRDS